MNKCPNVNDMVALLAGAPSVKLARCHVGTVVEVQKQGQVPVEFVDDEARVYALAPIGVSDLLVVNYEQEVA